MNSFVIMNLMHKLFPCRQTEAQGSFSSILLDTQ